MNTSRKSSPLSDIGVLITRPAKQAASLAQQVAALGGKPIIFPAIVILPAADTAALTAVRDRLAHFDIAIFVSANAVEYGIGDPLRWPRSLTLIAPGSGTAQALANAGLDDVRTPTSSFDSEGMLALPELTKIEGQRVLILRGQGGRDHLAQTLGRRGALVECVACYRRVAPTGDSAGLLEAWRERRIDAATFTSREGLTNLWHLLGPEGQRHLIVTPTFVTHQRIAERARALGMTRVVDTAPTDAGLLAKLLEYFAVPDQAEHRS